MNNWSVLSKSVDHIGKIIKERVIMPDLNAICLVRTVVAVLASQVMLDRISQLMKDTDIFFEVAKSGIIRQIIARRIFVPF
jgi:hypothetical protein